MSYGIEKEEEDEPMNKGDWNLRLQLLGKRKEMKKDVLGSHALGLGHQWKGGEVVQAGRGRQTSLGLYWTVEKQMDRLRAERWCEACAMHLIERRGLDFSS